MQNVMDIALWIIFSWIFPFIPHIFFLHDY